jgi:hypothetical protein
LTIQEHILLWVKRMRAALATHKEIKVANKNKRNRLLLSVAIGATPQSSNRITTKTKN